jgi:hypothetical protein
MVEGHLLGTGAAPLLKETPLSRPSVSPFASPFAEGGLGPEPVIKSSFFCRKYRFKFDFEFKSQK